MLAAAYFRRTGDLEFLRADLRRTSALALRLDRSLRRRRRRRLRRVRARRRRSASCNRGGRIRTTPCSTTTARWPRRRSRCARCRATSTRRGSRRRSSPIALGRPAEAEDYARRAVAMRDALRSSASGDEELGTYVLALDGAKRPCRVRDLQRRPRVVDGDRGRRRARARVAETLMSDEWFSGWGVRTLAATQARYNPMSYHNGSVWPHDTAIIAAGLRALRISRHGRPAVRGDARGQRVRRPAPVARAVRAGSRAGRARGRRCTRSRARRRRGRRARCSCCCRRRWACRSTAARAR